MNIEARKIEFIQEFLKLQSEETISKLEKILRKDKKLSVDKKTEWISDEELNSRIDKSEEDPENGRLTAANDLLDDIEKWS